MYGCQGLINRWFKLPDDDATILCQERRQTGVPPFAPYPRKIVEIKSSIKGKMRPPSPPPSPHHKKKKLVIHSKNVA